MGNFVGNYESITRVWNNTNLTTSLVIPDPFTRIVLSDELDALLPTVFSNYVTAGDYGCTTRIQNYRTARLYVSTVNYIEVIVPWLEGSSSFIQFFEEAKQQKAFSQVRYLGETINYNALVWHVNQN